MPSPFFKVCQLEFELIQFDYSIKRPKSKEKAGGKRSICSANMKHTRFFPYGEFALRMMATLHSQSSAERVREYQYCSIPLRSNIAIYKSLKIIRNTVLFSLLPYSVPFKFIAKNAFAIL